MKSLTIILITMVLATVSFANDFTKTDTVGFPAAFEINTLNLSSDFGISKFLPNGFGSLNFNSPESQGCSEYLKKGGYCTNYVYQRIGKRQRGDANQWIGNISITEGRAGDVGVQLIGKFGHVFVIEGPSYKPYTSILNGYVISEMNFSPKWVNEACGVTNLFGIRTQRIIPLSQVARIWRP